MMTLRIRSLMLFAAVGVTTTACKKKPQTEPVPVPTSTPQAPPSSVPTPPPPTTPPPATTGMSAEEMAKRVEAMKNTITATIYFDYDRSELLPDAQRILNEKIPLLKQFPGVRLRVVGHTDERGSDEYNLALGQRRAASAKTFITAQGIDGGRIDVVSMGESRPAMMGEGEMSWSKNRRDEFEIVAGADQIRIQGR